MCGLEIIKKNNNNKLLFFFVSSFLLVRLLLFGFFFFSDFQNSQGRNQKKKIILLKFPAEIQNQKKKKKTVMNHFGGQSGDECSDGQQIKAHKGPKIFTEARDIPTKQANQEDGRIFSVRYSPDDSMLAASCADGTIRVSIQNGEEMYVLREPSSQNSIQICWRPAASVFVRDILIASLNEGVHKWDVRNKKVLCHVPEDAGVYAVEYSPCGKVFATAGEDHKIRIYDDQDSRFMCMLGGGVSRGKIGHSNRIYALKFWPNDSNVLMSGGWDNCVHMWDLRNGQAVRTIYGPHCVGDAIDVHDNLVLTGSYQTEDPVQIWDAKSSKLMQTVPYLSPPDIYCVKFHADGGHVFAGGNAEAKIFDINEWPHRTLQRIKMPKANAIFHADFSTNRIAISGMSSIIKMLHFQ